MDTLAIGLGQAIRRRRLEAGLSQEQLAERADVHRNHVGFVERGERSPTVVVLDRIAQGLGIPAWELLKEGSSPPAVETSET